MSAAYSVKFAACLLGILPIMALGADPATKPVTRDTAAVVEAPPGVAVSPSEPDPGVAPADNTLPHRNERADGRGRPALRFLSSVTPKDIEDAMVYMKEHSPNRFDAINALPDNERKTNFKELAARNYVNWVRVLKEDPELYKVVIKRVEIEDQIYGLAAQLQKDPSQTKREIREKLRDKVTSLVNVGMQERKLRLDRLTETVQQQRQKLAEDLANPASLVDERLKTILKEEKGLLPAADGNVGSPRPHGPGRDPK